MVTILTLFLVLQLEVWSLARGIVTQLHMFREQRRLMLNLLLWNLSVLVIVALLALLGILDLPETLALSEQLVQSVIREHKD
jgi:hypothetical protein